MRGCERNMLVKELFNNVEYDAVWEECVKSYNFDDNKYPLAKESHKRVFEFVKTYRGIKSESHMIVCLHKVLDEYDNQTYIGVDGILVDGKKSNLIGTDFLTEENVLNMEMYALECSEFYEWADWQVSEESIKTYGKLKCAAEILWEMTYHGTTDEIQKERLKNIS